MSNTSTVALFECRCGNSFSSKNIFALSQQMKCNVCNRRIWAKNCQRSHSALITSSRGANKQNKAQITLQGGVVRC